ncbi:MAG: hypothetical protein ACOCUD_04700 [Bacillota bacterium]
MSIRNIQMNKAVRKIMLEELKSGVQPEAISLDYKLNKFFKENTLGSPLLNFIAAKYRKNTNLNDYNSMLDEIEDDLETLYLSLLSQNMNVINNFISFENQRNSKMRNIYDLNLKIDDLLTKTNNTNNYLTTISEGFNDFINVNLDKTTAFVDLYHKQTSLMPNMNKVDQVSLKNSKISVQNTFPSFAKSEEVNSIENCLNDYSNSSWIHKITLFEEGAEKSNKEEYVETGVEFLLELNNPAYVSQIELESNTQDLTNTTIMVGDENDGWTQVTDKNTEMEKLLQVDFYAMSVKKIKVTLTKEVFKYQVDPVIFSLKDISLFYNTYEEYGEFESLSYKIDTKNNMTIDKLSLVSEESIPGDSEITYTLDIKEKGKDHYTFRDIPITPNNRTEEDEYINLNNTSRSTLEFNEKSIIRSKDDDNYNIRFYKYNQSLDEDSVYDQSELYKGIKQWERVLYQYPRNGAHTVSLGDFVNKPVLENKVNTSYENSFESKITEYFDYSKEKEKYLLDYHHVITSSVEVFYFSESGIKKIPSSYFNVKKYDYSLNDDLFNVRYYLEFTKELDEDNSYFVKYHSKNINYMFTTNVYCEKPQEFITNKIRSHEALELNLGVERMLYINNKNINPIVDPDRKYYRYKGQLKKGWNRIMYVAYLEDSNSGIFPNTKTLVDIRKTDTNPDIKDENQIFGTQFRAVRNPMKYVSYYNLNNTILKEENEYFTIDKNNLLLNSGKNVNYLLRYYKNINTANEIIIKAKLYSEEKYLSHKIKKMKLNFFYKPEREV